MSKSVIITPALGRIELAADVLDPTLSTRIDIEGNGSLTINVPPSGGVQISGDVFANNGYFQGDVFINNINAQHLMIAYSIALG